MVEIQNPQATQQQTPFADENRRILKMQKSERMGGSMPVWGKPETAKEDVMQRLVSSSNPQHSFEHAMALQSNAEEAYIKTGPGSFGFGDIIDIVNPLHHIPVVGHLYREITGDEISSMGKIVGGGIFGGPAGAASGLVNAIAEEETGEDLAGNAMNIVLEGKSPRLKNRDLDPAEHLNRSLESLNKQDDLPASLLAFTNAHSPDPDLKERAIERVRNKMNDMAGLNVPQRDDITVVTLSDLPKHSEL